MYKYNNLILEKVNKYLYGFHLNEEGYFTENEVDYFISSIPDFESFNYETGATKCVIIPEEEDYVIKIPFNGLISTCSACEEDTFHCCRTHCPCVPMEHGEGMFNDDYCAREEKLYERIKKEYPEFKQFFLPIEKVIEINHYPVYVQAKGVVYEETQMPVKEKSIASIQSSDCQYVSAPNDWLAKCLEDLNDNIEKYDKFISMLRELNMTGDLHMGNVGYYKNHAVIIDYGGFFEN